MKFPNIDFDAINRMVNMLDDDQKDQIASMADSLMSQTLADEAEQEEEPLDYLEYLNIEEDLAEKLSGSALSALEAASDLEQFYSDVQDADLSASVLFLNKALLRTLHEKAGRIFHELEIPGFQFPSGAGLFNYMQAFASLARKPELAELKISSQDLENTAALLGQMNLLLQRAEYDTIGQEELKKAKEILFDQNLLAAAAGFDVKTDDEDRESADRSESDSSAELQS